MDPKISYLVFSDVKGYSQLSDADLRTFCQSVLPQVFTILKSNNPFHINSWGDAFVAGFDDPVNAAECSLSLRNYFRDTIWGHLGLPEISIRISLHAGRLFIFDDPITNTKSICGREVCRAARIEPIVPPGEVFTTELMIQTLKHIPEVRTFAWDSLGKHPLAKEWDAEELYRLRRPGDGAKAIGDLDVPDVVHVYRIPKNNDNRNKRMEELLSDGSDFFWLLALSGYSYLHERGINWKLGIKSHLHSRREMKVMLLHPDGEEVRIRRRAERRAATDAFLKVPLGRLKELTDQYENLEIRLTQSPIYCSLFFGEKSVVYDPYHLGCFPGEEDGQNQLIVVEFARGQCYDLLQLHFDFLWKDPSTVPLTQVVDRYRREMGE